jgi:hypothetical protein
MEAGLGLTDTANELWVVWRALPWAVLVVLVACVLFFKRDSLFGSIAFFSRRGQVTNSAGKRFKGKSGTAGSKTGALKQPHVVPAMGSVLAALFIAGLFVFSGMVRLFPGRSAILVSTEAYRVPDSGGAVNARFDEGQPVTIRSSPPLWYFVEAGDGRSGWVLSENVIFY